MEYFISLAVLIGIYITLSSSFNLIIGFGGLVSIAHPIFFALGAYTAGLLAIHFGIHPLLAVLAGGGVAFLSSMMLSLPSLRISGDYLMITSIGFQLGLLEVIKHLSITGGASGLGNIPNIVEGSSRSSLFALVSCLVAAVVVLAIRWLLNGPYGRVIAAMRDDELAFSALGRNAMMIKLSLFAIGSGFAGIAGGIYAYYYQYISPDQFEILQSAMLLTMVVVGGMGSQWGPVVGTILLLLLPQAISFLNLPPSVMAPLQGVIYTSLVLVFLFWRPQGLIAPINANRKRRPEMSTLISLKDVCKSFGGIVVADHISIDIQRGEILGLIGPNGAGKTSLFNLISGVYPADSGSISVSGQSLDGLNLHQRARLGVARTWQHMRLFASMSVLENMLVAPRDYPGEKISNILFKPKQTADANLAMHARAIGILKRMNLESIANSNVNDITFGQQKLVGLARALMNDGECLLLDEPMAGVEGNAYETMKSIVREEAAAGRAVCVVEHNVSFIKDLCNTAVFMASGKILERGSVDSLLASQTLADLYFGA